MLISDDEGKLRSVKEIVEGKLVKRKVSLKALDYATVEPSSGGTVRQRARIVQGIETEKAKAIVRTLKDAKLKVQASIQSYQVRVTGRNEIVLIYHHDASDYWFTAQRVHGVWTSPPAWVSG